MKRAALVVMASMLAAAFAGAEAPPVKIGAIEDLSGPTARYGVAIKSGFELAADEINAKGGVLGGRQIEFLVEDAAGQKDQAINAAKKLLARDKVVALLGPTLSNEMFAAGPVAVERGVPIIGTSVTANGITDMGKWVFRTSLPEADVVPEALRTVVQEYGVRRVALMYANDDAFSKSGFDVFKKAAQDAGLEIADIESFSQADTDFSPQLTKIKALDVDALLVSALVEPASGVVLQARQLGLTIPILGGNGFNSPKLIEIAGRAAEDVLVGSPWFVEKEQPENVAFVTAFRARYHTDPDQFAAQAYDTMFILAEALNRAGDTDPDKLHDALLATDHDGIMGPFQFTPHRDPASAKGVVTLVVKDGRFQILKPGMPHPRKKLDKGALLGQQLLNGLVLGSVYALFALGFTLVFGVVRVVNLLYGFYFASGAFIALFAATLGHVPLWLAAPIGAAGAGLIAALLDGVLLTPLRAAKAPELAALIVTLGGVLLFTSLMNLAFGTEIRRFPAALLNPRAFDLAGVTVTPLQIVIVLVALVMVSALFLFIEKTKQGAALRALAENPDVASLMGVNVGRAMALVSFVAGTLSGAAGILIGLNFNAVHSYMGESMMLRGFVVIIVGGLGDIRGALFAGLALGFAEVFTAGYVSSDFKEAVTFSILVLTLWIRPIGLFGKASAKRA
jgi:branched-chain amino acid transport system substrate-binding protein